MDSWRNPLLLSRGQHPKPRDAVSKTLFRHSCAVLERVVAGSGAFAKTQFRHSCAVRGYLGKFYTGILMRKCSANCEDIFIFKL